MSNYYKKEQKISYSFHNNIFIQVKMITHKYLEKEKNIFNVVAVVGTYTNTNLHNNKKLETWVIMILQIISRFNWKLKEPNIKIKKLNHL